MAASSQSSGVRAYATALLDSVQAQGGLDAARSAGEALSALAKAAESDRGLKAFFESPHVPSATKQTAIRRLGAKVPPLVTSFLLLLERKGRLELLRPIARAAAEILDERLGRARCLLTTAVPMPPEALARWAGHVRTATGKEPVMVNVVKPSIVAGAVVEMGGWRADGSVARALALLEERIVHAAAR
jgi:F0F1-type ATP synthase delta subunit